MKWGNIISKNIIGETRIENSVFLKVIDFGLRHPGGFTYEEIMASLNLVEWEKVIIGKYLDNSYKNLNLVLLGFLGKIQIKNNL